MKNVELAKKYILVIRKIRENGGVNHSDSKCKKMMDIAENILIEAGIENEANRGRYLWINTHVAYESDLKDFVYKYF